MNCSERLRNDTKDIHQATERLLIRRLKSISSKHDYINLLKIFHGFFSPIDSAIRNHIDHHRLEDIHDRRNVPKILDDLKVLGCEDRIPVSPLLPRIDSDLRAFGAMYVGEGSTLGGAIIAKMLRDNRFLQDCRHAVSFFDGYRDRTMVMWGKFQSHLNDSFKTDQQQVEIAAAAKETFSKMTALLILN